MKSQLCSESDLVQQQQSEIAALKSELTEIKGLLAAKQSVPPTTASYAAMAAGASHCQQTRSARAQRAASGPQRPLSVSTTTATVAVPTVSRDLESNGEKERVSGARRVWGTLPTTQTAAVISTLKKLTKAGSSGVAEGGS